MTGNGNGPLAGLRVLEVGQIAAGPFVGLLLADLGADVVKVERPDGGDDLRAWPPLLPGEEGQVYSGNFAALNRNKRSLAADLKDPEQVARLRRLAERADVLVENYRPGVLPRLGLGYDDLARANPRLIYCSVSGYGQRGPYAQKGAFDVTVQAISGLMSVTGEAGGPPVKCGVPVGDFVAGLYAAFAILAAILKVRAGGPGSYIDCSMLGSLLGIAALQTSELFGTGQAPRRLGSAHPRNAPYQGFEASDRPFTVAAGNDSLWRKLCELVGQPELAADPRFTTQTLRAQHQCELAAVLQPIFATKPAAHWLAVFDQAGIPCAPINSFAEILADPHVAALGWLSELRLPNGAATPTVAFPVALSGYEFAVYRQPPALGQHTAEVYREWLASPPVPDADSGSP